ncbi:MAG TPA: histidinol-phosphate transaminase [Candidatus Binatia bacterium]
MSILDRVPEYIRSLVPYEAGKPIEEVEREYGIEDSIKLASNENPLGPSPKALKALAERIGQLHLYPDGDSFYLKRALAAKLSVAPDRLIFGNGSNELIELAVRTFLRPGDEAVMAAQAFVIYRLVVQAAGGACRIVPLKNFTHDLDAIAEAITDRTRIVFLANPNNPTGTSYGKKAWEKFLSRVTAEALLVVDEAYFEYVGDPDYPNSIDYQSGDRPTDGRTILTLRTFSKLYGLAGLRIGYAVGPKELVGLMHRVRQPFNVNAAAQWAALAALEDGEHVERSLRVNREGMEYLKREIESLGLEQVPSRANFILIRVGDGAALFKQLLKRGVIVRPMGVYELPEYIRVTVGTAKENGRFINELKAIIASRA